MCTRAGIEGTVREYIWLTETEIAPTMGSRTTVDRPLAVVDAAGTSPAIWFVHVDHLNRPVKMTDGSKAVVWSAVWTPWGAPQSLTGSATLNARFAGQWFQVEAGLHYNWHRHYDPTLGRYTQTDPLELEPGPNVYAYANGDPNSLVDPSGQNPIAVLCLRYPRTCQEILNCIKDPKSCKKKFCRASNSVYKAICNIPGCQPGDHKATLEFKTAAAEACVVLRSTVGSMCYGDNEPNHSVETKKAEAKAARCRAQCTAGQ